jgi:hypothetical protein
MAVVREITAFERVELLEPIDEAPAGARGGVVELRDRDTAMFELTVQLWVALHGYATLRAAANDFPWPDADALLDDLINRLAYIDPPASGKRRRRSS